MSNGLKNIQSHARAYARRERIEAGLPAGYDDDSGISGVGLTPVDDMEQSYGSPETTASTGNASVNGSGSSTASHPTYSTAMHSQGSYQGYNFAQPQHHHPGASHGYANSISSTGTAAYATAQASQNASPYIGHGSRLPSVDMGIESIINRGPGGGGA
jgi:hypothetical protein